MVRNTHTKGDSSPCASTTVKADGPWSEDLDDLSRALGIVVAAIKANAV